MSPRDERQRLIRGRFCAKSDPAKSSQLQHKAMPRLTNFGWNGSEYENTIHEIYAALIANAPRNDTIVNDVRPALLEERSPLRLTSRTAHLDYLTGRLRGLCQHVFVLKRGMGAKQENKSRSRYRSSRPVSPDNGLLDVLMT